MASDEQDKTATSETSADGGGLAEDTGAYEDNATRQVSGDALREIRESAEHEAAPAWLEKVREREARAGDDSDVEHEATKSIDRAALDQIVGNAKQPDDEDTTNEVPQAAILRGRTKTPGAMAQVSEDEDTRDVTDAGEEVAEDEDTRDVTDAGDEVAEDEDTRDVTDAGDEVAEDEDAGDEVAEDEDAGDEVAEDEDAGEELSEAVDADKAQLDKAQPDEGPGIFSAVVALALVAAGAFLLFGLIDAPLRQPLGVGALVAGVALLGLRLVGPNSS